jgi:hypothetical protein
MDRYPGPRGRRDRRGAVRGASIERADPSRGPEPDRAPSTIVGTSVAIATCDRPRASSLLCRYATFGLR